MADEFDDDAQQNQEGTDLVDRRHIRALEEKARKADEYEARLATMERETAFAKALGTAAAEPWFPYFQKGYEGELTPEAIREAASAAGFAKPVTEPTPESQSPPANPNDLAAIQRMAQAQVGSAPPPPADPFGELASAQSQAEVMDVIRKHGEQFGVLPGDGPQ